MSRIVWSPSEDYVRQANVTRFMRAHGIQDYDELVKRSQDDIEWFWDAVVKDLGIEFYEPYDRVMDDSAGTPWTKWFTGGTVNPGLTGASLTVTTSGTGATGYGTS